ncbi:MULTISPECIES: hypothetical protein [Chryseobacterium]|uniref:EpsG family protein n=1 Tax=Chryseobacterium camelliae TaxID=1265445 RepID=A0ABU0TLH4_9FLAO|nr:MULTISPECIES: hypothetical protein [Chryseobacterium]MDT3408242.1 hypothetical protein [Pseudacidovorax intermedius]MDQ1097902.1 hypothetical protein [Chryseobacterium camelliae]MDQ1101836.1 hypothetical protein [Chryseobacterium sp. SORGH_AS_1048]MDR6085275.1 hypothetical protein [Chryseobacterium sp. SORGH_AS_0909]MDR6129633.1 hypothetical protein [Chryseobacterium sp. SORGH_AS_1175]
MKLEKFLSRFNIKIFIYLLIAVTALYTLAFTLVYNLKDDGYILADWLVNYQDGGFKRRGLSGSFFFLLQDMTGIRLNYLVYFVQFAIISSFFWYYTKLIRYKRTDLLYLSLLLSSIGFVGLLNTVTYVGKKEFIVFLIFTIFIYVLDRQQLSKKKEYLLCFALVISTLLHEVTVFFVPYFAIGLYLKTGKLEYRRYIKYFLAAGIPAILIFVFGKNINEGQSLKILSDRGVHPVYGIFFWNINERQYIIQHSKDYILYGLSFIISTFHIAYYLKFLTDRKLLSILLIGAFVFSIPLFYLAIDWGRWMYIHMMLMIVLFALSLQNGRSVWDYQPVSINSKFYITCAIIILSLLYRVEMSGKGFTWEGLLYRIFIAPAELLNKM